MLTCTVIHLLGKKPDARRDAKSRPETPQTHGVQRTIERNKKGSIPVTRPPHRLIRIMKVDEPENGSRKQAYRYQADAE
eukprot:m.41343 g.41343  ORF g.41343 m.41343 type:complete len:79 (+) comp12826_c0_seq5:259-495(+)